MEAIFSSKKCITNQDNHDLNKMDARLENHHTVFPIEDLFLRFSCVCDVIFNYLDTKSLINCRLVSTTMKNHVDNHKPFWKSIIQTNKQTNKLGPLHIVTLRGYFDLCQVLIKNMTDKNPSTDYGLTPLHIAARTGWDKRIGNPVLNQDGSGIILVYCML